MFFTDESKFEDFVPFLDSGAWEVHTDSAEVEEVLTRERSRLIKFDYGTIFLYIFKNNKINFDDIEYMCKNFKEEIIEYLEKEKGNCIIDEKSFSLTESNNFYMISVDWEETYG